MTTSPPPMPSSPQHASGSSEPEWKYPRIARYLVRLKRRLIRRTRWTVFERHREPMWARARASVENLLMDDWRTRMLVGIKPEQGFFVRCDRTTMTQDDIDQGRLIILVGVAPLRPAEFVIFRIGHFLACP